MQKNYYRIRFRSYVTAKMIMGECEKGTHFGICLLQKNTQMLNYF